MGLYEDMLARQKRTEEFIKARDMTQSQVVEKLLKAEPELKSKGYSVNLSTYLKENKINPKEIKDSSWMRPTKQTALRTALAAQTQSINQRQTKFSNAWSNLGSTPKINLPLANQSPIKQNDVLPPSETPYQEIPPVNSGRIELNPNVTEPDWIKEMHEKAQASTPAKSDNSKYFAIGGIAIAAIVLLLILRRRK